MPKRLSVVVDNCGCCVCHQTHTSSTTSVRADASYHIYRSHHAYSKLLTGIHLCDLNIAVCCWKSPLSPILPSPPSNTPPSPNRLYDWIYTVN